MTDTAAADHRADVRLIGAFAVFKLLLHLGINLWGGYGIFRDELYYLACADHLAWGYVDHPPLSIFLLAATEAVLGDSLFALRFVPAVAGAALVFVTGLLARELGGGRFAIALASSGSIVAAFNLAVSSIWSMNIFDLLLTALAALWLTRLIKTGEPRYWITLGLTLGLGLLNKVGVLWVGLGVFVGVLLSRERRWLSTPWPWLGGALSALLFLPYVLWNAANDWAHIEFIDSAVTGKYSGLSARTFLSGQVLNQNPSTLPLWLAGLFWLFLTVGGRRFRPLGILWLTACTVLIAGGHSKAEYLASTYAILFAAGGVAWESLLTGRRAVRAILATVVAAGILLAPLASPILPVESYVSYSRALGLAPSTDEGHELAELPQFYADMFGWPEKAAAVAAIYHALPAADRDKAAIFTDNYGRAGAIDYFAAEHALPGAVANHNNYWIWGPGDAGGEVLIVLGGDQADLERRFESVGLVGVATCEYCIPYERDVPIYVARQLRLPIDELWPLIKHYD